MGTRKCGQRFTPADQQILREMLVAGRTYAQIILRVGCSREAITAFKHRLNGTKPRWGSPYKRPFLTDAQVKKIGEAEADRLLSERKREILYTGWRDDNGNWRDPIFPAGPDSRSLD